MIWLKVSVCVNFRSGYEQDVELGNTANLGDCQGKQFISNVMPYIPQNIPKKLLTETQKKNKAILHSQ